MATAAQDSSILPHHARTHGVCGGKACIDNTRIRVTWMSRNSKAKGRSPRRCPARTGLGRHRVTLAQVYFALRLRRRDTPPVFIEVDVAKADAVRSSDRARLGRILWRRIWAASWLACASSSDRPRAPADCPSGQRSSGTWRRLARLSISSVRENDDAANVIGLRRAASSGWAELLRHSLTPASSAIGQVRMACETGADPAAEWFRVEAPVTLLVFKMSRRRHHSVGSRAEIEAKALMPLSSRRSEYDEPERWNLQRRASLSSSLSWSSLLETDDPPSISSSARHELAAVRGEALAPVEGLRPRVLEVDSRARDLAPRRRQASCSSRSAMAPMPRPRDRGVTYSSSRNALRPPNSRLKPKVTAA